MDPTAGWFLENAWIIPVIMAGSFLTILFFGKRLPERGTAAIGITAVSACLVLSLGVATQWVQRVNDPPSVEHGVDSGEHGGSGGEGGGASHAPESPVEQPAGPAAEGEHAAGLRLAPATAAGEGEHHEVPPVVHQITWFQNGGVEFKVGTLVDGLTAMMLVTVTIISLLVHIYSREYLHGDVRFTHYYAFLSLFTAAMLFYVMSSSTLQMVVGWELVGVCSFVLIGHWWEEKKNTDAALKAFLTNRVGDVGLLLGVVVTFFAAGGTFEILEINGYALSPAANQTLLLIGALLLFGGVTSKSGQFPLHTWLPDAMAGPTPVSALIHAATMVVAGVYLIARLYAVFFEGLNIGSNSINYVALIGGVTILVGASLAFVQHDIKKVLAYSTISQLGYMVMALGVGAWTAGVFHLFTHAFFKAGLFLGAGSVSHAAHHTFDMREMGGLRKHMPSTFATFVICTAALMGIFPLAGFWSKDEILAGASQGQQQAYTLMLVMGAVGALLTAAYMTRAIYLTFFGEYRGHGTPHESPRIMTIPLWVLSVGAITFGFLNFPKILSLPEGVTTRFEHYVEPTFLFPVIEHPTFNPVLAVVSSVIAVVGFALAYQYYWLGRSPLAGLSHRTGFRQGYVLLENKYYLDTLYSDIVVGSTKGPIARASYWFNQYVIDAVVNAAGRISVAVAGVLYRDVDQRVVDGIVNGSGYVSESSGQVLRRIQTGKVQQYAAILFAAAAILAGAFVLAVSL
ncbi:NADH-quinone oxidoreductase subunit L [Rhabdothermincola sp.]|uniref:NADH-quinone oxidoreductase subunit L n=1 Tax=Rhabdothermincola sp. TaxID=2820405 RepID=UPI002FE0FC97